MTDTLFENRLSEMLPEHTTQVPHERSRGRLGGAPRQRTTSGRGKRQSCTTSRFRLTAHPRLPGHSLTLSLICVVKENPSARRETAVTARGRRNGLAIKGLSAEAVQLSVGSVYRGAKRQCHGFLPEVASAVSPVFVAIAVTSFPILARLGSVAGTSGSLTSNPVP